MESSEQTLFQDVAPGLSRRGGMTGFVYATPRHFVPPSSCQVSHAAKFLKGCSAVACALCVLPISFGTTGNY